MDFIHCCCYCCCFMIVLDFCLLALSIAFFPFMYREAMKAWEKDPFIYQQINKNWCRICCGILKCTDWEYIQEPTNQNNLFQWWWDFIYILHIVCVTKRTNWRNKIVCFVLFDSVRHIEFFFCMHLAHGLDEALQNATMTNWKIKILFFKMRIHCVLKSII